MTAFELNEELKDRCILLNATKAITTYFKKGFPLLPEPFWETIIIFPINTQKNLIRVVFSLIKEYMKCFEENEYNCADPVLEFSFGAPRIVYAIFPGDLSFTEKELNILP